MKKFMKVCGITALILIVLGLFFGTVGAAVRGRIAVKDVLRAIRNNGIFTDLEEIGEAGAKLGSELGEAGAELGGSLEEQLGEAPYELDSFDIFDERYEILSGHVEKYALEGEIERLDVQIGGCTFYLEESQDNGFYVEAENMKRLQAYVEGNTLHIKAVRKGKGLEDGSIILYVPAGHSFAEADFEVGAGAMELGAFYADKTELEVGAGSIFAEAIQTGELSANAGAGEITAESIQAQKVDAQAGMGYIYLGGRIEGQADLECSMGSIELYLRGTAEDFNYVIECGLGSVELEDTSYSGLAYEKKIDNGVPRTMNIECAMGTVSVSFAES